MENKLLEALILTEDCTTSESSNIIDNLFYIKTKKENSVILKMIRDTWNTIKDYDYNPGSPGSFINLYSNNKILRHFLFIIQYEINKDDIKDIAKEILECGLDNSNSLTNSLTMEIIEEWQDKEYIELLKSKDYSMSRDIDNERLRIIDESEEWICQN